MTMDKYLDQLETILGAPLTAHNLEKALARNSHCSDPTGSLFDTFKEVELNKVEGTPIEDCAACAGEGDMLVGENEWETCLNCGGLGYTEIENSKSSNADANPNQ